MWNNASELLADSGSVNDLVESNDSEGADYGSEESMDDDYGSEEYEVNSMDDDFYEPFDLNIVRFRVRELC